MDQDGHVGLRNEETWKRVWKRKFCAHLILPGGHIVQIAQIKEVKGWKLQFIPSESLKTSMRGDVPRAHASIQN